MELLPVDGFAEIYRGKDGQDRRLALDGVVVSEGPLGKPEEQIRKHFHEKEQAAQYVAQRRRDYEAQGLQLQDTVPNREPTHWIGGEICTYSKVNLEGRKTLQSIAVVETPYGIMVIEGKDGRRSSERFLEPAEATTQLAQYHHARGMEGFGPGVAVTMSEKDRAAVFQRAKALHRDKVAVQSRDATHEPAAERRYLYARSGPGEGHKDLYAVSVMMPTPKAATVVEINGPAQQASLHIMPPELTKAFLARYDRGGFKLKNEVPITNKDRTVAIGLLNQRMAELTSDVAGPAHLGQGQREGTFYYSRPREDGSHVVDMRAISVTPEKQGVAVVRPQFRRAFGDRESAAAHVARYDRARQQEGYTRQNGAGESDRRHETARQQAILDTIRAKRALERQIQAERPSRGIQNRDPGLER